ncbi:MAG: CZB domain-containing protein [Bradyrhizobium sp.]|nr:CZB domain-containing protein [Bradyrhizobium sp.]
MSLKEEITKAIGAHGMWKARLKMAIETGKTDASVTDVGKDNVCAFGQWLYGPSVDAAMKGSGEFKEVQKLHAEFHKIAAQVLQLALQGKKGEADKVMAQGSAFTDVSGRLTSAMMRWQKTTG